MTKIKYTDNEALNNKIYEMFGDEIAKEQAEMDAIIRAEMDAHDSNPNGYMSQIMSEIEK